MQKSAGAQPLLRLEPVPRPVVLVMPLVLGFDLGSGVSPSLRLPVPRPDVTVLLEAALFLDSWIFLKSSPDHFVESLSTSMVPVPRPVRIFILTMPRVGCGLYLSRSLWAWGPRSGRARAGGAP